MRSTGLKKCMPAKFSGRSTDLAMRVMEMVEVFEARMASGRSTFCSWRYSVHLGLLVLDDRLDHHIAVGQGVERHAWC